MQTYLTAGSEGKTMAKKKTARKKIIVIEKSIKGFLADEDGFVSKETILKVGLATAAGIGVAGVASGHDHSNYTCPSVVHNYDMAVPDASGTCYKLVPGHVNFPPTTHSSY